MSNKLKVSNGVLNAISKLFVANKTLFIVISIVVVGGALLGSYKVVTQNTNADSSLSTSDVSTGSKLNNPQHLPSNPPVTSTEESLGSLEYFRVYSPINLPGNYADKADVYQEQRIAGYDIQGKDGARFETKNSLDKNTTDPVCKVRLAVEKPGGYAYDGVSQWQGETVIEIAKNANLIQEMRFEGYQSNPPAPVAVSDLRLTSVDGTKIYTMPTIKFSSPNGGHVLYFSAAKLTSGDYAVAYNYCVDMHGANGYAGAQPLTDEVLKQNADILGNLRIKPTKSE